MNTLVLTRPSCAPILSLLVFALAAGCSRPINQTIVDARLVMDVRTALVNDSALGLLPLEITAAGSVVHVVGSVPSEVDRQRIVTLVRSVPGVRDVEVALDGPASAQPAPPLPASSRSNSPDENEQSSVGHLLSLGLGLRLPTGATDQLDPSTRLVPFVRFGRGGNGFGPVIGFTGIRATVRDPLDGRDTPSRLRIAPLMGGVGYRRTRGPWSLSMSGLAGYGFNSISLGPSRSTEPVLGTQEASPAARQPVRVKRDVGTQVDRPLAIAAGGSFVLMPTVSIGRDVTSRASLYFSTSYLYSRPDITWIEGERIVNRSLEADTIILSIGFAYWVF